MKNNQKPKKFVENYANLQKKFKTFLNRLTTLTKCSIIIKSIMIGYYRILSPLGSKMSKIFGDFTPKISRFLLDISQKRPFDQIIQQFYDFVNRSKTILKIF